MKKLTFLALAICFAMNTANSQCLDPDNLHTFTGYDSYGDGWDSGSVDILVNGSSVLATPFTISAGTGTTTFLAQTNDQITLVWVDSSYPWEVSFTIFNPNGGTIGNGDSTDSGPFTASGCPVPVGSCAPPSSLSTTSITSDSATVTWLDSTAGDGSDSFDIDYTASQGTPTTVTGVTSPYTITGLTSGSAYTFNVTSNCASGSETSSDASFETIAGCGDSISFTYENDFNAIAYSFSAPSGQYASVTMGGEAEDGWDYMWITDGSGNDLYGSSASPITGALSGTYESTDGTILIYVNSDGSAVKIMTFAFSCYDPPACTTPTNLSVSGVTTTSATLNWDSEGNAFMIEIQGSGVPQGTQGAGGYVIGDVDPYPLTSVTLLDPDTGAGVLTSNTSYDFWVVNVCADGNSEYAGPFTFTTPCDTVTVFPYAQGFEDLECWTNDNPSAAWQIGNGVGTANPGSVTEGSSAVFFNSYGYQSTTGLSTLMSPSIDLSALTVPNLTFDFVDVGTSPGSDVVEVVVENGSGAVVVSTLDQPQEWTSVIIDLSAYANETIQIGFRVTSDWGYSNPHIDNLMVAEAPACLEPSSISYVDVTNNSAGIVITADSFPVDVVISVGVTGFDPEGTTGTEFYSDLIFESDTFGISLEDPNTTYDVYVKLDCGTDGFSTWAGPITFTSANDPIVPNYTNDFTTFPGDFWTTDPGVLNTFAGWVADGFANDGNSGAAKINIYTTSSGSQADDALISPSFNLSGGTYYLNMTAALTPWNATSDGAFGEGDYVSVSVTENAGVTWVELYRWDSTNNPSAAGAAMPELDLSSYASPSVHVKIFAQSGIEVVDNDFFIDDFSVTSTSLGLEDVNTSSNFTYFPNPVNNVLSIKAQASIDSITVYNMLGQTVVRSTPNTTTTAVDMSGLQTGAYFVQVAINNSIETVRVIKN